MLWDDKQIYQALTLAYAEVVDHGYLTYCALTSEVCRLVLAHFGVAAEVVACQLVASDGQRQFGVGYVGDNRPGKWDGHAVCLSDGWLFDGTLRHVAIGLGVALPVCVAVRRVDKPGTDVIARFNLAEQGLDLSWRVPPYGANPNIPSEPKEIITPLAAKLIRRVGSALQSSSMGGSG